MMMKYYDEKPDGRGIGMKDRVNCKSLKLLGHWPQANGFSTMLLAHSCHRAAGR